MQKILETLEKLESAVEHTESWCDTQEERLDAKVEIDKLTIELEMEIEVAKNGDYTGRISRFKACVNDMFKAGSLSDETAKQNREWAMENLYVLRRAAQPME